MNEKEQKNCVVHILEVLVHFKNTKKKNKELTIKKSTIFHSFEFAKNDLLK
jgi:hypothetical protein